MALEFTNQSSTNSSISINIIGDGTSTTLDIDLTLPPFSFDYKGNKPVGNTTPTFTSGSGTVTQDASKTSFTITYNTALANGSQGQVLFNLLFNGI